MLIGIKDRYTCKDIYKDKYSGNDYHAYDSVYLGCSDKAMLKVVGENREDVIYFGEDGNYKAYLVDKNAEIGDHYKPYPDFHNNAAVYDDNTLVAIFEADIIRIYTAGNFGCIVQLINKN